MSIREHLEAIRDRHRADWPSSVSERRNWCNHCTRRFPCPDHADAVAALAELDAAKRAGGIRGASTYHSYALVPDPQPSRGETSPFISPRKIERKYGFQPVADHPPPTRAPKKPPSPRGETAGDAAAATDQAPWPAGRGLTEYERRIGGYS